MKLLLAFLLTASCYAATYNVRLYGAKGDGSTNDNTPIQNAVNAAQSAGGGEIYFPKGSYVTGQITITNGHVTVRGEGPENSILIPNAANISILVFSNGGVTANGVSDVGFYGGSGVNGVYLQGATYAYNAYLRNLEFNVNNAGMNSAIVVNEWNSVKITDIHLWGQAPIKIGNYSGRNCNASADHNFNTSIQGMTHYPAGATLSGALIYLQCAVQVTMSNVSSQGLQGTMDGIHFDNDCQGIYITNTSLEGAYNGILASNTAVGGVAIWPQDIHITNSSFDQPFHTGIDLQQAFSVTIVANHFTNLGIPSTFSQTVHAAGKDVVISDNLFWISLGFGNGIVIDGGEQGATITNNAFTQIAFSGGTCIFVQPGSDFYEIQGNTSRARGASANWIIDNGSGAHRSVQSSASWPN